MKSSESWLMDETGDIKINSHIKLTDSQKTIAQRLQNKISLNYGEWFLHNQEGVNWFGNGELEGAIGKKFMELILDSQIQEYVKNDKDVYKITRYETDFNDNSSYIINITAMTKNNEIIEI